MIHDLHIMLRFCSGESSWLDIRIEIFLFLSNTWKKI